MQEVHHSLNREVVLRHGAQPPRTSAQEAVLAGPDGTYRPIGRE